MKFARLILCLGLIAGFGGLSSGCESFPSLGQIAHELKPHRLHRWNRNPPPNTDPYFSVSDPIPELEGGKQ